LTTEATGRAPDERVRSVSKITQLMRRPELGAVSGLVIVILFFVLMANPRMFSLAGIANFASPSAQLGILAIGAALLMIGGEFDLSIGSMVGFSGLVFGACLVSLHLPLFLAILITLLVAGAFGMINGLLVIRTGLPSFIVTLAFLFILRGLTLVGLKWVTGGATQLRGVREAAGESWLVPVFSGAAFRPVFTWMADAGWIATFHSGRPSVEGIPVEVLWFIVLTFVGHRLLQKTKIGNWIFASGGDQYAARNSGVPVWRVKVGLFVTVSLCAALVAVLTVLGTGSTDAQRGLQKEFEAIIAAVIGGALLTGGYGSVIGTFFGAVIFGMVLIGLSYTSIDQDWYLVFLGGMLLIAVLFNNVVRKRVTGER
jgi:simple sugar transport system permease protein